MKDPNVFCHNSNFYLTLYYKIMIIKSKTSSKLLKITTFFTYYMIFYFIDHKEMLKCKVGRIMTKLAHRHSLWTSYRASYPTLLIYDEIWLLSWMQCDLWQNLWRNWHNVIVFGLHIRLHIERCESMTKSDYSSWMQCDLWRNQKTSWEFRHGSRDFL
jgi:hypothetical protein